MDIEMRNLRAGDILIFADKGGSSHTCTPECQSLIDPHAACHTAIVGTNIKQAVHAMIFGVISEDVEDLDSWSNHQPFVYRSNDGEWAREAARVAESFAAVGADDMPSTKYSEDRSRGVALQNKSGILPPFEFDALYRAVKWAMKSGTGASYSVNHGATCCAFVASCYQAAKMICITKGSQDRIRDTLEWLKDMRVNKVATKNARHANKTEVRGELKDNYYKREVSNVGAKHGTGTLEDIWEGAYCLLTKQHDLQAPTFEALFSAFCFDAKYIYSATLQKRLAVHNDGWQRHRLIDLKKGAPA